VFSFLTTDASPDVAPIHPDATPVLLLDEDASETWMNAPWELAQVMSLRSCDVPHFRRGP
jgi:putative SOS response-associated peptidase YedK